MAAQPKHLLKQLVRTPAAQSSYGELMGVMHMRSATTLSKVTNFQFPRDEHGSKAIKPTGAFEAYAVEKPFKRNENGKLGAKKHRRNGIGQTGNKLLRRESLEQKAETGNTRTPAKPRTDDDTDAIEKLKQRLLEANLQVIELKREVGNCTQFICEMHDYFAKSEGNGGVDIGLTKMREFLELRQSSLSIGSVEGLSTPELSGPGNKRPSLTKPKSECKLPSSSHYSSQVTPRYFPQKADRLTSPSSTLSFTPSLNRLATVRPSGSSTPLDQLESTADKLEFIKLKTLGVLQALSETGAAKKGAWYR